MRPHEPVSPHASARTPLLIDTDPGVDDALALLMAFDDAHHEVVGLTIAADILVRQRRQRGEETFFLTGTDEHGSNIPRVAAEAGLDLQELRQAQAAQGQAADPEDVAAGEAVAVAAAGGAGEGQHGRTPGGGASDDRW